MACLCKEKVNNFIYQTIEGMFDIDEMITVDREDYGYAPIEVISPNYDKFFLIYFPEYWSDDNYQAIALKKRSPILQLEKEYEDKLNGLFGILWHDQMIKWVEDNFLFLPKIKTLGF